MSEEVDATTEEPGRGIRIEMNEDGTKLLAHFIAPPEYDAIDKMWVLKKLSENGFDNLLIESAAIDDLIRRYNDANPPGTVVLGERRNAEIDLRISKDKSSVYLTIFPAYGGTLITVENVRDALKGRNITYGIMPEAIEQAVTMGQGENILIAKGDPIEDGIDASFECLLPEIKDRRPYVSEKGSANYRDLGSILTVEAGEKLMRRIPPTAGIAGKNVHGDLVPPRPGKDLRFAPGLTGVISYSDDPDLLISTIKGQPVVVPDGNGVNVEDTYTALDVDLSIGNIDFEGTVNIKGSVKMGMSVRAEGDIYIAGNVEAAKVEAGGNIVIAGGVIGHGDVHDTDGNLNSGAAKLIASGSVSAKFLENSYVVAGNNIFVEELVSHSDLSAVNEVIVGKKGAKKAQIIGGSTRSGILIKADRAGSVAAVTTCLEVGVNPILQDEVFKFTSEIDVVNKKLQDVEKILSFMESHPEKKNPDMYKKATMTRLQLMHDVANLEGKIILVKNELAREESGEITIEKVFYAGTRVKIAERSRSIDEDIGGRTFKVDTSGTGLTVS